MVPQDFSLLMSSRKILLKFYKKLTLCYSECINSNFLMPFIHKTQLRETRDMEDFMKNNQNLIPLDTANLIFGVSRRWEISRSCSGKSSDLLGSALTLPLPVYGKEDIRNNLKCDTWFKQGQWGLGGQLGKPTRYISVRWSLETIGFIL